jgi:hypothetical protein
MIRDDMEMHLDALRGRGLDGARDAAFAAVAHQGLTP